jgi:hypothetical protein
MHEATRQLLRFFEYEHLPAGKLRGTSMKFHELAHDLAEDDELAGPELTTALRKLLEAKDCAVRAALD